MKKDVGEVSVRGFAEALQEVVDAESEMDYRYDKAEKSSQKWVDEGEKKVRTKKCSVFIIYIYIYIYIFIYPIYHNIMLSKNIIY